MARRERGNAEVNAISQRCESTKSRQGRSVQVADIFEDKRYIYFTYNRSNKICNYPSLLHAPVVSPCQPLLCDKSSSVRSASVYLSSKY